MEGIGPLLYNLIEGFGLDPLVVVIGVLIGGIVIFVGVVGFLSLVDYDDEQTGAIWIIGYSAVVVSMIMFWL